MKIRINEDAFRMLMGEARGLKSKKLFDILKTHGGWDSGKRIIGHHKTYASSDWHNMTDDDIINVMSYDELSRIGHSDTALTKWAKNNGLNIGNTDCVQTEKLGDGSYLVYIDRNAYFDRRVPSAEGGFKDLYNKKADREKNRMYQDNMRGKDSRLRHKEGVNQTPYIWNNKEAEDAFHNPYFKNWPGSSREAKMQRAREWKNESKIHDIVKSVIKEYIGDSQEFGRYDLDDYNLSDDDYQNLLQKSYDSYEDEEMEMKDWLDDYNAEQFIGQEYYDPSDNDLYRGLY